MEPVGFLPSQPEKGLLLYGMEGRALPVFAGAHRAVAGMQSARQTLNHAGFGDAVAPGRALP